MTAGATFYISGPTLGHVPEAFHTHGKDPCWIVTLVSGSRASQPRHRSSQIRVDGMQPSAPKSVSLASFVAGDDRVRGRTVNIRVHSAPLKRIRKQGRKLERSSQGGFVSYGF